MHVLENNIKFSLLNQYIPATVNIRPFQDASNHRHDWLTCSWNFPIKSTWNFIIEWGRCNYYNWKVELVQVHHLLRDIIRDIIIYSVLTRILHWGVPGPPLRRNRGPVRTLGSLHSKKSVTWSTYLIQYGGWGVYDSITMHAPIFAMYVVTMKVKEIKLKTLNLLISCFLFIGPSKMTGCCIDH